jgi:DNA-binding transcriptional regulator YdaS (Cro superfamily)
VTPLAPAERENIISQAKLIATTTGITPEEALYRYAKTQGVSHSQLDQYMGWPDGTTAQWAQANPASKAVQLTSASRSRVSPLSDTQRQSIVADAQKTAQLLGISPEEALYRYAQTQGLSPSQVDQYMGWPTGTTARWAKENVPAPSAAPVQPLSGAQRDSIIEQAKKIAKLLGISTEEALYRYSQAQGLTPAQVDQYMGWGEGTTAQWAATNFDTQQPSAYKGAIDTTLQAPVQPIDQSKYRHALPTSLQKQEYNRLGDIVLPPGQVSSTPQGMQHITGVYQSAPPLYDYTNAQGALAQPPATGPSAVVPGAEGTSSLGATNKYLHDLLGIGKPLA